MKWVCFPKFYGPLANWPWLRISPHGYLNVIYCLIITAWQWWMRTFLDVTLPESNKSLSRQGSGHSLTQRVVMLSLFSTGLLQSVWSCLSHPQHHGHRWPESASQNAHRTDWAWWKNEKTNERNPNEIQQNIQGTNSDRKETRTQSNNLEQKEEINI